MGIRRHRGRGGSEDYQRVLRFVAVLRDEEIEEGEEETDERVGEKEKEGGEEA
jgi:hypothetical protein